MSASASADGATTRALQETEIDAAHYGGPCRFGKSRCGSKLATTRKRPFSQYGQRANSMCVTRFMNLATDSITAACGGGTSSRDKTSGSRLGSQTAGKKSCAAPRKRGHSKNGRGDAPQIVVGMAVTRDGFPVRHWVFPGNTVDVTTVAKVNDDTLTAEDMALGYKQQQRVEEAWRTMKSGLRMRPVFHWAPHRIHAHIAITVLSLLLERAIEHACQDTWRNIRDDLKHIQLALLSRDLHILFPTLALSSLVPLPSVPMS